QMETSRAAVGNIKKGKKSQELFDNLLRDPRSGEVRNISRAYHEELRETLEQVRQIYSRLHPGNPGTLDFLDPIITALKTNKKAYHVKGYWSIVQSED